MGFPIENSGSTKRETLRTIMKSFNSCPESAQEYQENWRTNRQQQFYQTDFRPESESALQDSRTVHNQSHRQILDDEATLNITQLVSWRLSDPDQVVLSSHSANSLSMTKQHFFQYHHQSNNPVSFRFIDSKSMVVRSIKQQAGLDTMIGLSAIRELAIMSLDYLDSASTKRLQYGEFATQGGSPLSFGVDIISQQPLDQNNLRNGIEDYMKSKINTTQMLALKRRAPDYLKLLNESLTTKIMNLYMQGYQTKCIAHILGIKEKLVKKTLRKKSQHSERTTYNRNATKLNQLSDTTKQKMAEILRGSGSIITSKYIQEELKRQLGLKVSKYHIIKYLVRDLGLTYHKVYQITPNHNTSISKLARQLAAAEYIRALCRGKILINVDETIVQSTDNRNYSWAPPGTTTLSTPSRRMSKVSITAAACSNGELLFTVNNGTTNSSTFINFLILLVKHLSRLDPWWQTNYLIIVDNAPYHKSFAALEAVKKMDLPLLFLGPYQFDLAPVEQVFRCIKQRDLNETRCPVSTKRQLSRYIQLLAFQISNIDMTWLEAAFQRALVTALKHLSLQDV